jgi:hypothetical protein
MGHDLALLDKSQIVKRASLASNQSVGFAAVNEGILTLGLGAFGSLCVCFSGRDFHGYEMFSLRRILRRIASYFASDCVVSVRCKNCLVLRQVQVDFRVKSSHLLEFLE